MAMKQTIKIPFPFKKPGIMSWCRENLGKGSWHNGDQSPRPFEDEVWICVREVAFMRFEFKNESDATMFALKWL